MFAVSDPVYVTVQPAGKGAASKVVFTAFFKGEEKDNARTNCYNIGTQIKNVQLLRVQRNKNSIQEVPVLFVF